MPTSYYVLSISYSISMRMYDLRGSIMPEINTTPFYRILMITSCPATLVSNVHTCRTESEAKRMRCWNM